MIRIKEQFRGLHAHRYDDNPQEYDFAAAWQERNKVRPGQPVSTLAYLLTCGDQRFPETPSVRDWQVANTVIQWLGSPVGREFLDEVLGKDQPR